MKKHNRTKSTSHLIAAMEGMELRRQLSTVTGTIFSDTDRDGRIDAGEPGLAGRTVFADYNYNGVADASEPKALTNASGNYSLTTRASQVSLRVALNANEQLTLGYGATSIWLPTVNGTVSGKNFGINTLTLQRVYVSGFTDFDGDNAIDSGERSFSIYRGGVDAWVDLDGNNHFNPEIGEALPEQEHVYHDDPLYYFELPAGTHRIRFAVDDQDLQLGASSSTVNVAGNTLSVTVGVRGLAFAGRTRVLTDQYGEITSDLGNPTNPARTFFFDADGDNILDAGERYIPFGPYGNEPINVLVKTGTFTIGGLLPGESSTSIMTIDSGPNNNTVHIQNFIAWSTVGVTVFSDLNRDGIHQYGIEPGAAGVTVFADLNGNNHLDASEPRAVTDTNGNASLRCPIEVNRTTRISLIPPTGMQISTPNGNAYTELYLDEPFALSFTGLGLRPVASSPTVTGRIFSDIDRDGRIDAGEAGLTGRTVFADYDYDGVLDANEPRALTDASGNYSLATRASQVSLRVLLNAGEQLTLGYGATSIWLSTVNGTVSGKNFPIAATQSTTVTGFVYLDLNGNGQRDAGDRFNDLPVILFIDLNNNGTEDQGEPNAGASPTNGSYTFTNVPAGMSVTVRARYFGGDTQPATVFVEPLTWYLPARTVQTVAGGTSGGNFGLTRQNAGWINAISFDDVSGNGEFDSFEREAEVQSVWLDLNANGRLDAQEPTLELRYYGTPSQPRRYYLLAAPLGEWRVAARFAGDTDNQADVTRVVNVTSLGSGITYLPRPAVASVSGTVFADGDGDGRIDTGESGFGGRRVFVDSNFNGRFDAGETFAITEATGAYTLLPSSFTLLHVRLALNANESLSLGSTGYWFAELPGSRTGRNFGVIVP